MGVFIYPSNENAGMIPAYEYKNIIYAWQYDNELNVTTNNLDIKVFAIEMVYIPEGNFYAGDKTSYGTFKGYDSNPVLISKLPTIIKTNLNDDDAQLQNGILIDAMAELIQMETEQLTIRIFQPGISFLLYEI